ncbi:MAG: lysine--tRNA ligase [Armatimonadota bacterium]|nr:lysine--tRNA ligase [Armatimonadota bacterium]MDR7485274.1 lysine--tRNA ligase [Armatimonadota bacterium]MDR7533888.1 lysine--tRNA ligase [Armatimonadota bacterium]MDR7537150.1 lysine--tRNA ligase [Armatimonadota bacterium]
MWVDLLADEILKARPEARHVVNDAKSPSGRVHVGSLRGVILHDCLARALRERGRDVTFLYGYDDYDPLDGVPAGQEALAPYLGRPLCDVPAPDPAAAPNFARYYADEFTAAFTRLGATPRVYWTSEMYRAGTFDQAIRTALDRAQEIIELDRAISSSRKAERHPVQVVCQACGRIGTTVVVAWDGREVAYECRSDKVTWATGCGHRGRRSPFGGGSKLQYITEWAAKWVVLGVTVEAAGKDHMTRGGSYDRAAAIVQAVYGGRPPFAFGYEFFLVGGRKMRSSAGVGMPAAEFATLLRPDLARFAIVRPHYRQHVDFDPGGDTIPALYDEFDRAAAAYFGRLDDPDLARSFHYAQVGGGAPADAYRPRFVRVVHLCQMPAVDIVGEIAREKGGDLSEADRRELDLRLADARRWLRTYAPESQRFEVQPTLPAAARELSQEQRRFLAALVREVEQAEDGETLHAAIHALKAAMGLAPTAAFGAIYRAFLGKDSGPQAGWFLAALDRAFVVQRLREAAGAVEVENRHG